MKTAITTLIFLALFTLGSCKKNNNPVDDDIDRNKDEISSILGLNPVVLYSFDNNFSDYSVHELDLSNNNTEFVTDRNGNQNSSIWLNGINSFLKTETDDNLDLKESFTFSVWINTDLSKCYADKEDYIDLFGRWFATGENASSYSIALIKDGYIQGRTYNYEEGGNTWIPSTKKIKQNQWTNIIVIRNSNGFMELYIDGQLAGQSRSFSPQSSVYELFIGKRRDNRSFYYGKIDDLIILDDAINRNQVERLMKINL